MAEVGRAAPAWRDIAASARLVGSYCWVEDRLFGLAGEWAGSPRLVAEARVWSAAASRRHGLLACAWAERLPVRAGVDRSDLVVPPAPGADEAIELLAAHSDTRPALAGLLGVVLPCLWRVYRSHLRSASPVSEAPIAEVLARAVRELAAEMRSATGLTGLPASGDAWPAGGADNWASVVGDPLAAALGAFEQAWGGGGAVLPAERPS